ncbi:tetracycline resistance protein, tetM/tetO subfamily [Actinorhabdospora filicis]|uniref:Tetracycline resistance protein, tetM/tetO subfamily n=1 Tax=Actinorhabdospora filicis TaxID=1785913 RepID=A0A9W6SPV9_9ACTN|nr:GTP-binding protein [Actinorhabdospora filicis]GLZ79697.1 tetracycline resistance protein, tetM/tetO subfamily [Actinorhabdospora filicis]
MPLNLGIVAHVDAGKTSLTERLLHLAGVIDHIGSVDRGSTQTDTLEQERRRGITIQSAVVAFTLDGLDVNLIDTPGHGDFIAEVSRALSVLDGAVLVVSAVEGVQAQTRVLHRVLTRLGIPTLIFVNKVDRVGAREDGLLADLAAKLAPGVVAMTGVDGLGTRAATVSPRGPLFEALAETLPDDRLLESYVDGVALPEGEARAILAEHTRAGRAHPVYFGSAITGAGVPELMSGLVEFLPVTPESEGPPQGSVFKIERGPAGEKVAYVRLRSGVLRPRERVEAHRPAGGYEVKPTAVRPFTRGSHTAPGELRAGGIAKVWGMREARIGDAIGSRELLPPRTLFAPPTLETVVRATDRRKLFAALTDLAERDPLIDVRAGDDITVSLYGEVQKEVIAATLAAEFGVEVTFDETRTVHIERPTGTATARRWWGETPWPAAVELRVEPAEGVTYGFEIERGALLPAYHPAIEDTVYEVLKQGVYAWRVEDVRVTLTASAYSSVSTNAGHFRRIVPLALAEALAAAGTDVHVPLHSFELEAPAESLGALIVLLKEFDGELRSQHVLDGVCHMTGLLEAGSLHGFERRLPPITSGEFLFLAEAHGHRRVDGDPPVRERVGPDPFNQAAYLLDVK